MGDVQGRREVRSTRFGPEIGSQGSDLGNACMAEGLIEPVAKRSAMLNGPSPMSQNNTPLDLED